jgi:hypothetical protein
MLPEHRKVLIIEWLSLSNVTSFHDMNGIPDLKHSREDLVDISRRVIQLWLTFSFLLGRHIPIMSDLHEDLVHDMSLAIVITPFQTCPIQILNFALLSKHSTHSPKSEKNVTELIVGEDC